MCGIVGVGGSVYSKEKDAFQDMLIFSQTRGPHSTGAASVSRKDEVVISKCVGRPDVLIDYDKRYDKVVDYGKKFMLGHNRWATTGKINKRNAHPFMFDNVLGCHNGTIPEHRLKELKKSHTEFGTDSEAVLANINEFPLKDVFKKLAGAWAFVWFDVRDNTINMLRNSDRELFYTYSKDRQSLFWASEKGFIEAALQRHDIDYKDTIHVLPADKHFRWDIPEMAKAFDAPIQVDIKSNQWENSHTSCHFRDRRGENDAVVRELALNPQDSPHAGGNVFQGPHGIIHPTLPPPKDSQTLVVRKAKTIVKDFESPENLRNLSGQGYKKANFGRERKVYRGFNGVEMTEGEFKHSTRDGCVWCTAAAEWGRPVRFLNKNDHICLDCAEDPKVVDCIGAGSKAA